MKRIRLSYGLYVAVCVGQVLCGSRALSEGIPTDSSKAAGLIERGYDLFKSGHYDSSMACYKRAKGILEQTRYKPLYLRSLNGIAENYVRRTQCDSALRVLMKAVQIENDEFGGMGLQSAGTYTLIGYVYSYQDHVDQAIDQFNKGLAIRIKELGGDHPLVAASHYMLGVAFKKKGEFNKAIASLHEALRIQRKERERNRIDLANTLMAIGTVYQAKSEYSSSIGYFSEALSVLAGSSDRSAYSEASCHFYLAMSQQESGDIVGAIGSYTTALDITRGLFGEEHQTVSTCYAKLGELYRISGDYDKAIEFCERALRVMIKANGEKNSGVAAIYSILAEAHSNRGALDIGLEYCLKALSIQRRTLGEYHPDMSFSYESMAGVYQKQHKYSAALKYYSSALDRRLHVGGPKYRIDIGRINLKIGTLYVEMQRRKEALEFLAKAVDILNNTSEKNQPLLASAYKTLGDLHFQEHDYSRALSQYDRSITLLQSGQAESSVLLRSLSSAAVNKKELLDALIGEAQTREKCYEEGAHDISNLQSALSTYERAVEIIEQLRRTYEAEGSKLFLQGEHSSVYDGGARVSVKLLSVTGMAQFRASAYLFAEKSKANVLLDGIQEAESRHFGGIPDSVLAKEQKLRTDISLCETQLLKEQETDGGKESKKRSSLQNRLFTLDRAYQGLLESIETSYPKYYDLKYKDHFTAVAAVQRLLDARTCLLEYFIGERSLYIFAVTKDLFDVVSLPKPRGFEQLTTAFCQSIKTVEPTEYLENSNALYRLLLQPIEKDLVGKKRLVIVPDGILYYLPFEALFSSGVRSPNGSAGPIDFTRLPYLVRRYEISYSYSSSFYAGYEHEASRGQPTSGRFMGFAPVFRDSMMDGYILASNLSQSPGDDSELRSFTVDGRRFRELPYSEEEVRSITTDFAESGKTSVGFFRSEATKENFTKEAGKYNYIHIATHGFMNEREPKLSALVFAQPPHSTAADDAILYAGDTYNLTLNADLVVLSSCESGTGQIVKGEGMMGMTRGFIYAGARSILYSLWKVFDKQTNELMQEFYKHVLDGDGYSSSLREAKLKMIKDPSTAFPCKWAGFVLLGK